MGGLFLQPAFGKTASWSKAWGRRKVKFVLPLFWGELGLEGLDPAQVRR